MHLTSNFFSSYLLWVDNFDFSSQPHHFTCPLLCLSFQLLSSEGCRRDYLPVSLTFAICHLKTFFLFVVCENSPLLFMRNFHTTCGWKFSRKFHIVELFLVYTIVKIHPDFNIVKLWQCWLCGNFFFLYFYFTNILDFLSTCGKKKYWESHETLWL